MQQVSRVKNRRDLYPDGRNAGAVNPNSLSLLIETFANSLISGCIA